MLKIFLYLCILTIKTYSVSKDDYFSPSTSMNISISTEILDKSKNFNIFFIKGKLSYSENSLQYNFFDSLIFTHTRVTRDLSTKPVATLEDLTKLLNDIINDNTAMQCINDLANTEIQPLIFDFESTVGSSRNDTDLQQQIEQNVSQEMLKPHNDNSSAFSIYANHFINSESKFRSIKSLKGHSSSIYISVKHYYQNKQLKNNYIKTYTPVAFEMFPHTFKDLSEENKSFIKFDFVKYDNNWLIPSINTKPKDNSVTFTTFDEQHPQYEIINQLNKIFSLEKSHKYLLYKPITNFITNNFEVFLKEFFSNEKKNFNKISDILDASKEVNSATFYSINKQYKEINLNNHNLIINLKQSFNKDLYKTNVLLFNNNLNQNIKNHTPINKNDELNKPKDSMKYLFMFILFIVIILSFIGIILLLFKLYKLQKSYRSKKRYRNYSLNKIQLDVITTKEIDN